MRRRIDIASAMTLLAGFLIFLTLVSFKTGINFDAAYNLLSYQSLFDGKGFVYTYSGQSIPFDPTISTGPELYLPAFFVWALTGSTSYYAATYVLIFYYGAFLSVLLFWVLKDCNYKTATILSFLLMFFSNKNLFDSQLFIIPVGEPVSVFFLFIGIYCLYRKALFFGFLLIGFALDTKSNLLVGLLPMLVAFGFIEYVLPVLKGDKKLAPALGSWVRIAIMGFITLVPYFAYSKIAPAIVLGKEQKLALKEAQEARSGFMIYRGFGQMVALKHNFNWKGVKIFGGQVLQKFSVMRSFFKDSLVLLILFVCSYPFLLYLSFRRRHYSLYLFIFSLFFVLWWVLGGTDAWFRYFFVAQLAYGLGIVSLISTLMENDRLAASFVIGLMVAMYAPQFSLGAIRANFDDSEKRGYFAMKEEIKDIDERKIFAYGWFQDPQMMFLTHKRFQDYRDTKTLQKAKEKFGDLFFITSIENNIIREETEKVTRNFELLKSHSNNRLYSIK
jgi:hypothetical protein